MSDKVYVRGHFRRRPQKETKNEYPDDESKCIKYCKWVKQNSRGEYICSEYFDLRLHPFRCEKFVPKTN